MYVVHKLQSMTELLVNSIFKSRSALLKLINNSSSLNKGNHDRDGVWKSDLN